MNKNRWNNNAGNSVILVLILIGIVVFWFIYKNANKPSYVSVDNFNSYTTERRNNWELFLYSSNQPNTDYQFDTIEGLVSKEICLNEGIKRTKSGGSFECGYKCKTQYYTLENVSDEVRICQKICFIGGCRD